MGWQRRDEEVKVCQQRMRLLSTECKSLVKAADEAARVAEYGVDKAAIHATMAKLATRLSNLEDVLGKVRFAPSVLSPDPGHCFSRHTYALGGQNSLTAPDMCPEIRAHH